MTFRINRISENLIGINSKISTQAITHDIIDENNIKLTNDNASSLLNIQKSHQCPTEPTNSSGNCIGEDPTPNEQVSPTRVIFIIKPSEFFERTKFVFFPKLLVFLSNFTIIKYSHTECKRFEKDRNYTSVPLNVILQQCKKKAIIVIVIRTILII